MKHIFGLVFVVSAVVYGRFLFAETVSTNIVDGCYYVDGQFIGVDKEAKRIVIPAVIGLSSSLLNNCHSVTDVVFAAGAELPKKGYFATIGCSNLVSIVLPSSVLLRVDAFMDSRNLTRVVFQGDVFDIIGPKEDINASIVAHQLHSVLLISDSIYYPKKYANNWRKVLRNVGYGGKHSSYQGEWRGSEYADSVFDVSRINEVNVALVTQLVRDESGSIFPITNSFPISFALSDFDQINSGVLESLKQMSGINNSIRESRYLSTFDENVGLLAKGLSAFLRTCVIPDRSGVGFVVAVTEVNVDSAKIVSVPLDWARKYDGFEARFGSDMYAALSKKTGKYDAFGRSLTVLHDYIAGTDPTKSNDVFNAAVEFDPEGNPVVVYSPIIENRKYTIFGKRRLQDGSWEVVPVNNEAEFNFFKVTVDLK